MEKEESEHERGAIICNFIVKTFLVLVIFRERSERVKMALRKLKSFTIALDDNAPVTEHR